MHLACGISQGAKPEVPIGSSQGQPGLGTQPDAVVAYDEAQTLVADVASIDTVDA